MTDIEIKKYVALVMLPGSDLGWLESLTKKDLEDWKADFNTLLDSLHQGVWSAWFSKMSYPPASDSDSSCQMRALEIMLNKRSLSLSDRAVHKACIIQALTSLYQIYRKDMGTKKKKSKYVYPEIPEKDLLPLIEWAYAEPGDHRKSAEAFNAFCMKAGLVLASIRKAQANVTSERLTRIIGHCIGEAYPDIAKRLMEGVCFSRITTEIGLPMYLVYEQAKALKIDTDGLPGFIRMCMAGFPPSFFDIQRTGAIDNESSTLIHDLAVLWQFSGPSYSVNPWEEKSTITGTAEHLEKWLSEVKKENSCGCILQTECDKYYLVNWLTNCSLLWLGRDLWFEDIPHLIKLMRKKAK